MVEIITHAAFYLGWPNAWAVFPLVWEAYAEDKAGFEPMFGLGEPNEEFAQHFDGQSYLNRLMKAESGSITSPSLRAAVTTGTSIAPSKAGDRSF